MQKHLTILVIGGGGREHALTWKLCQSQRVARIWCAPGNAGIATERLRENGNPVETVSIGAEDLDQLLEFAEKHRPDLTVVGPDNPLALGVVDRFESRGFKIWGPNQKAARFESSKIFSLEFMQRHGIPTAKASGFDNPEAALKFALDLEGRCAVKADGLALGKGVLICLDHQEARQAIDTIMVQGSFGNAGRKIVVQELLTGSEISLHVLCDGSSAKMFPTSQDHKRALDGDKGLNTGGMGVYSPAGFIHEEQLAELDLRIIQPWLEGCRAEGIQYRGVFYPGLMLTSEGPKVLEFNARFGDPETQVYLMRLENDLVDLLEACLEGTLHEKQLQWSDQVAICVVMASEGYPGPYEKGRVIRGIDQAEALPNTKVFHAGTARQGDQLVNSGGRVLGVTTLASGLEEARTTAYEAVSMIDFDGAQYRSDIAAAALSPVSCAVNPFQS